ncbi:MAG: IS1634 family transposase [Chitinophagaceae bacterium]
MRSLRLMYFKFSLRSNNGNLDAYYRLVESYRNETGRVCHRTILNIGFISEEYSAEQLNQVARVLTERYQRKQSLFTIGDMKVAAFAEGLWKRIIDEKRLDLEAYSPASRQVDADSLRHSHVREIGAEWLCHQTFEELRIGTVLSEAGFSEQEVQLAATQIISRAVYPASELKTASWIGENSAVCELTGYDINKITKDKLYESALRLYQVKDRLEQHLSHKTNELFDLSDKIVLYDLTNTYFEGRYKHSKIAKFGRSKEKRKDARLVVLALVVNIYGFIKYSCIHEGNMADSAQLPEIIDKLSHCTNAVHPVVVMDAGIATEENLRMIRAKGYHYLCVSRSKLKDYHAIKGRLTVLLETKSKRQVRLKAVTSPGNTDYYLEVASQDKHETAHSMRRQFEERFEMELEKISQALHHKGGIKKTAKVHERIGRAREKYPSVGYYYDIEVKTSEDKLTATKLDWSKNGQQYDKKEATLGIYFLRTSLPLIDEVVIWNVYNTIREVESSFRCLKTDLDLRPIYHKNDDSTMAHLHLGLLAYWLVNTIRFKLKAHGINSHWPEIVRIGNTQKIITTHGTNRAGVVIGVRKCSEPIEALKNIQSILLIKPRPFAKRKSVVHKLELKKIDPPYTQGFTPIYTSQGIN